MRRALWIAVVSAGLLVSRSASAQAPPSGGTFSAISKTHDVFNEKQHHYLGQVEFTWADTTLFADDVWYFADEDRAVASGNVVLRQGTSQISADRTEFDTKTRLGIFYNATGFSTIQRAPQPVRAGVVAPPPTNQENVVYFFGDVIEKLGPKKYKITNGGFTTCVQPTPRWDLHAGTVILNIDHYTFLTNAVLTAKGVPMLYLPVMYYPTNRGDRATGFLIPTYGISTLRGQSIHNAFFWAINRSQDATISHDWFSKTGQGVGGEYRYNFGGGDDGGLRATMLDQHETTYAGSDVPLQATRSYELHGAANQTLPAGLRARASVDYFSSFSTMQTYNTNLLAASQSQRSFGGNVVGAWNAYTLNATVDHRESFFSEVNSALYGSAPRVTVARNERPLGGTPFYFSATGEYADILSDIKNGATDFGPATDVNLGLMRLDVNPQVRFPFKRWQWFTVNSSLSWRDTYYTRSYDPSTIDPTGATVPVVTNVGLNRQFFTLATQITGPVFNRIWDTPKNGYAEKFKHSVEPFFNVQRTSSIDNFDEIVKLDGTDWVVGGATSYTYGVTNRLFAKRRAAVPGQLAQAREILTIDLRQTYYTDDRAALVDRQYQTSNQVSGTISTLPTLQAAPSHFSPVALDIRGVPSNDLTASMHAEFDATYHSLRTISANANYNWGTRVQTGFGWSKRGFIPNLPGFNDPRFLDQAINSTTTVRTRDNQYGLTYSLNYDILNSNLQQQRITAFYNAQCCGVAFEYQTYHFNFSGAAIPADHRFFMSFTLAGLGNFSPFNGALSGVPR